MKKALSLLLAIVLLFSLFTVAAGAWTKPVPGYYVVGTMNNWTIDKDYLMKPYFGGHYILYQTTLSADDEFKVVYSSDGLDRSVWYPDGGELNNYKPGFDSDYCKIELAPEGDGEGDEWYRGVIRAYPCEPPTDPTETTGLTSPFIELWNSGAELTADDIELAVNNLLNPQRYIFDDKIDLINSYRFNCTPAYVVDYEVEGYGFYATVILEERLGDYLFYSTSSYEPQIFIEDKLKTFIKAYKDGDLTDEMLAELAEADYKYGNHCKVVTGYIIGDADGDGDVNAVDATCIQRYDIGMFGADRIYRPLADVDSNSYVDVIDATFVQRYSIGLGKIW